MIWRKKTKKTSQATFSKAAKQNQTDIIIFNLPCFIMIFEKKEIRNMGFEGNEAKTKKKKKKEKVEKK